MFIQDIENYDASFSRIAWSHVVELRRSNDDLIKKQIFGNFNHLIRVWSGNRAKFISHKALELFSGIKPDLNPFDVRWEQRNILGFDSPRKPRIVWEHSLPVGQFIKELSTIETFEIFEPKFLEYPGACWITREEDDKLNSSGFKNGRPGGYLKCYTQCGIEVISEEEFKKSTLRS